MDKKDQSVTIRMPIDLYNWLAASAEQEQRSINGQVVYLLRQLKQQAGGDTHQPAHPT